MAFYILKVMLAWETLMGLHATAKSEVMRHETHVATYKERKISGGDEAESEPVRYCPSTTCPMFCSANKACVTGATGCGGWTNCNGGVTGRSCGGWCQASFLEREAHETHVVAAVTANGVEASGGDDRVTN